MKPNIDERLPLAERLKQPISYRYDWIISQINLLTKGRKLTILDVGSSNGLLSYLLLKEGHSLTAIDIDSEALLDLKDTYTSSLLPSKEDTTLNTNSDNRLIILSTDVLTTNPSPSFNVVVCSEVLEHLEDRKLLKVLKEYTIQGGYIIITTPIERNLYTKEHINFYNLYTLIDVIKELFTDFKICKLHKFLKYQRPKNLFGIVIKVN
jgi:2-polyprenyl-3-methyl-5-hydroxy-6-metoxy-1,4-benzoquinol methylase